VEFLGKLCSDIDVRACLTGDDDPWEFFFRWQNGTAKRAGYEPDYEEAEKDKLPDVYLWWHKGLPEGIKDGFINEWK